MKELESRVNKEYIQNFPYGKYYFHQLLYRSGAGAPIYDNDGNLMTNTRAR